MSRTEKLQHVISTIRDADALGSPFSPRGELARNMLHDVADLAPQDDLGAIIAAILSVASDATLALLVAQADIEREAMIEFASQQGAA